MIKVTVMDEPGVPARLPETIGPITVAEIAGGDLQEGQDLDFKREVHVDKPEAKARLLDDVVAFLNRGPGRLVIGVEERGGRFDSFRPQQGDADKAALRLQTIIQDGVSPIAKVNIPVPIGLAFNDEKHMAKNMIDAINGAVALHRAANQLVLEPAQVAGLSIAVATIVSNYLSHWSTGQTQAFTAPALRGVMQAIDDFAGCFQFEHPSGSTQQRYYRSLSQRL